jgi:hypothetical protein
MSCILLEIIEQCFIGRAKDIVDLVHLVDFVIAWEERKERYNFKEDASYSPKIHFVAVVAICQQTFWSSVPSSRNILGIRLLRINASTGAKISKLDMVLTEEDIFWFDISVENSVSVHVID